MNDFDLWFVKGFSGLLRLLKENNMNKEIELVESTLREFYKNENPKEVPPQFYITVMLQTLKMRGTFHVPETDRLEV